MHAFVYPSDRLCLPFATPQSPDGSIHATRPSAYTCLRVYVYITTPPNSPPPPTTTATTKTTQGDAPGAERVLGQILMHDLAPSLTTYNTLLQAYVRRAARARRMAQEEFKRVLQVWRGLLAGCVRAMRRCGPNPPI